MTSRFSLPSFLIAVLATVATAHLSGSASADSVVSFKIVNDSGGSISRADFEIIPAGSVQPPVIGTDPTTGQPQTANPLVLNLAASSGFDPSNFHVALGSNATFEGLRLLFGQTQVVGPGGQITFVPVSGSDGNPPRFWDNGGVAVFSLNLAPNFAGPVTLAPLTPGIQVSFYNTPEPMTLALWTAIGLGVVGCRKKARRSPSRAPSCKS